ncbi:hypothetical protein WR25_10450 [Diploscapter pachys]|uniref:G-protein coupled receptors family 3 profile domain-containing protein n=1 Tax=Diploscapter pachys TaxID=2018661 RepID=A0A2A2LBY1_9BILA|nr:hypothetical protein WR25_10450 [Diploscapter pachys]
MFVKTNRIARIFAMASRSKQRPMFISPISQLVLTGIIVGIQLTGSLIWLLIVPPDSRYDYPRRDQVVLTCNVPDHHFLYSLAYDALLIILCTFYAVKTRKVPENFNETKWIGFAMYTTCVIWLTWVFFFIGTGSDFQNLMRPTPELHIQPIQVEIPPELHIQPIQVGIRPDHLRNLPTTLLIFIS